MDNTILSNYEVQFLNIENHRKNDGRYEFLFKILSDQELELGYDDIHVQFKEYVENSDIIYYYIWMKDMSSYSIYREIFITEFLECDEFGSITPVTEIYNHCRKHKINTLYCFIYGTIDPEDLLGDKNHKRHFSNSIEYFEENYDAQLDVLRYLKRNYSNHRFVYNHFLYINHLNDYSTHLCNISEILKIAEKGDIIFSHSYPDQIVKERDIIFFERIMENIMTHEDESIVIERQISEVSIENVIERTKKYIEFIDHNSYIKKTSIETIVLATSDTIAKDSSLKVLPKHLIRQICTWF